MTDEIIKYKNKDYISFHTPCHKGRNKYINKILDSHLDLTELPETDNLFFEEGCIKEFEERMAKDFGALAFYPLVNGATSGVMAALSLFKENDKIIIDRNCHISAINAIKLNKLNPVFINTTLNGFNLPECPKIRDVRECFLKNPDAKGIFITNPNYYGMSGELKEIIAFSNENNLVSIVDEAHGSHYYYIDNKKTATAYGADICILSFHKNLPSLTQTGGILINNINLKDKLKEKLRCFTSTSPSYLFMLSIDTMNNYMKKEGKEKLKEYYVFLSKVRSRLQNKGIKILTSNDPFKFVVNSADAEKNVLKIKEKYKIVPEMWDRENITYIISIHNYKREIELLKRAICEFLSVGNNEKKQFVIPKKVLLPHEAEQKEFKEVKLSEACGRISFETVIDFPPSVPVVIPGERIEDKTIKFINKKTIKVVKDEF